MDTLFICASFFGYQHDIIKKLQETGRNVMWFEDRPATDNLTKALIRINPVIIKNKNEAYFKNITEKAVAQDVREVFVIKGEALSPEIIKKMRKALPKARFVLYFWDTYGNMPKDSIEKVGLFDKALSFDPVDVSNDSRLGYRPLFYADDYPKIKNENPDIDVLFLGTIHSDRYEVIKRISSALPSGLNFKAVMYMRSRRMYQVSKLVKPSYWKSKSSEFIFKSLSRSEVMAMLTRSRTVIDIERSVQTGFTMRTIEMLGASKKLITTNPWITSADFFNANNQLHVDRFNVNIPESFIFSDWLPTDEKILGRYSIDGWINDILG